MPEEIRQLDRLQTLEVSLVPKGANKKRFALRKGDTMKDIIKAVLEMDVDNEAAVDKVLKAAGYSEKAGEAFKAMYKIAQGFKDEMPAGMMKQLADMCGYDAPSPEDTQKVKKGEVDVSAMPPEVRSQVEALWKANKESAEKNAKLEATLKAERDERVTKEFVAKAATEFAALPGMKADELGKVLKAMHEAAPTEAKAVESLLKSASEAIAKGEVLRQAGQPSTGISGSAWTEIERLADGIVQKSTSGVSKAQAIDLALKTPEGGALYRQYLSEHPAQTGRR